jgi:hypothetical protein
MTYGLNLRVDVHRMSNATDDDVGGAVITGTVVYANQSAAIYSRRPSQLSLDQGLETEATFDLTMNLYHITLWERDEIEVISPTGHPFYGQRFRITGVQPGRRNYRVAHQHATLSRIRRSRSQQ